MKLNVPEDLAVQARNASARLGVQPNVVCRAAIRKFVDRLSESEALAEDDPELREALRRKRQAEKAQRALAG